MPQFQALANLRIQLMNLENHITDQNTDDAIAQYGEGIGNFTYYAAHRTTKFFMKFVAKDAAANGKTYSQDSLDKLANLFQESVECIEEIDNFFSSDIYNMTLDGFHRYFDIRHAETNDFVLMHVIGAHFIDEMNPREAANRLPEELKTKIRASYSVLAKIDEDEEIKKLVDTQKWISTNYPKLNSNLYNSADEFNAAMTAQSDDFPLKDEKLNSLTRIMYEQYVKDNSAFLKNLWTRDLTAMISEKKQLENGENGYPFWLAYPTTAKDTASIQEILLLGTEDPVDYIIEMLEFKGLLKTKQTEEVSVNIQVGLRRYTNFVVTFPSITLDYSKNRIQEELTTIIEVLSTAGGNGLLDPKKYKNGDDLLNDLKDRGLLNTADINDPVNPGALTDKILSEINLTWHKVNMPNFRQALVKIKLKEDSKKEDFNEGSKKVFEVLDSMGIFNLSYRRMLFEEWSNQNYPLVDESLLDTTIDLFDSKAQRAKITGVVANKIYNAWMYVTTGVEKLKATCENTKNGIKTFAGDVDNVLDAIQGVSTLVLQDMVQGVSFIRYVQLAFSHKNKYNALDKEFKANRLKLETTADNLIREMDKINLGSGDQRTVNKLQNQKADYDSREFYLSYALHKKVKQIMEDVANAIHAFANLVAKILEISGVFSIVGLTVDVVNKSLNTIKNMYFAGRAIYKKMKGTKGKFRKEAAEFFVNDAIKGENYANTLIIELEAHTGNKHTEVCKTPKAMRSCLRKIFGGRVPGSSHQNIHIYNNLKERTFFELSSRSSLEAGGIGRGIMKGIRSL